MSSLYCIICVYQNANGWKLGAVVSRWIRHCTTSLFRAGSFPIPPALSTPVCDNARQHPALCCVRPYPELSLYVRQGPRRTCTV